MQFTGKIKDVSVDYNTGLPQITFLINERDSLVQIDRIITCEKLNIEAKKYRKKRSLDANAYAWELIGKLAIEMNLTNVEVYRHEIGISGVYDVIPLRDDTVDRFTEVWTAKGLGWICETFPSKFKGFTNVRAFYGSSIYDTKEMSRLIDNIIHDCKTYGIETKSQAEIDRLLEEWEEKHE